MTNLDLLLTECNFGHYVQTRGLVRLGVLEVLCFEDLLVFFAVGWSAKAAKCKVWRAGPAEHVRDLSRCGVDTWTRREQQILRTINKEESSIPSATTFLTRERPIVDIWREMVRDGIGRMHEESQRSVRT